MSEAQRWPAGDAGEAQRWPAGTGRRWRELEAAGSRGERAGELTRCQGQSFKIRDGWPPGPQKGDVSLACPSSLWPVTLSSSV